MSAVAVFSFATTAEEVATAFSEEISRQKWYILSLLPAMKDGLIQNMPVIITGTSLNGIGFETAARHCEVCKPRHHKRATTTGGQSTPLANYTSIVQMACFRLRLSEDAIKKDVPTANIRRLTLDLSSLAGSRSTSSSHNAAAPLGPFKLTVDGLESQIATDHVGPFLFTKLLANKLIAANGAHAFGGGVDFAAIEHPDAKGYDNGKAYFSAKSATSSPPSSSPSVSKGAINAYIIFTNINQKEESLPVMQAMGVLGPDGLPNKEKFDWKTIPQGAATTVAAAFDPRISDKPGSYLDDSKVANEAVVSHSSDPANSERLWTLTEKIIGEKFVF
ncbi:hypothetical protein B0H14DRAFT_3524180 [Mycena olivaceomarginata]|nr:hypothetical protein B0H14DRAFT_3524180 [Mycena olivaceomarginata]